MLYFFPIFCAFYSAVTAEMMEDMFSAARLCMEQYTTINLSKQIKDKIGGWGVKFKFWVISKPRFVQIGDYCSRSLTGFVTFFGKLCRKE